MTEIVPNGYISIREAVNCLGRELFPEAWTGKEHEARRGLKRLRENQTFRTFFSQVHQAFESGLRKAEAAQAIGKHLNPKINISPSFISFREAIIDAVA